MKYYVKRSIEQVHKDLTRCTNRRMGEKAHATWKKTRLKQLMQQYEAECRTDKAERIAAHEGVGYFNSIFIANYREPMENMMPSANSILNKTRSTKSWTGGMMTLPMKKL